VRDPPHKKILSCGRDAPIPHRPGPRENPLRAPRLRNLHHREDRLHRLLPRRLGFHHWAREHGIPVGPGRGSGAGCLVAYLLGITNLDPLRFKLLFERFLNPERVSPPDFDIDFCMRRRGEVIDYVRQKYGNDCVANIITYGTLGAKMVIRDVSRVHDLPYAEADRLAKMIPDELNISLEAAIDQERRAAQRIDRNPSPRKSSRQARVLEGMVRNTGKHAAGIIITDQAAR
jgi:DNA polymerase-3 subunit alpha